MKKSIDIPNTIPVPVYFSETEDGIIVFDREEMLNDFNNLVDDLEAEVRKEEAKNEK
jgi:hypothetical protein